MSEATGTRAQRGTAAHPISSVCPRDGEDKKVVRGSPGLRGCATGRPRPGGHSPWGCGKTLCCLPGPKDPRGEGVSPERGCLVPDPSDLPKDRPAGSWALLRNSSLLSPAAPVATRRRALLLPTHGALAAESPMTGGSSRRGHHQTSRPGTPSGGQSTCHGKGRVGLPS